ncbi:MAG: magnesium chelatase, partial [Flavobacteriales bacterium]|nr:magnesium chelatase [Flavobacteriales bacterium]
IEVNPVPFEELRSRESGENSENIRNRVVRSREIQTERYRNEDGIHSNAQLTPKLMKVYCEIDSAGEALLKNAVDRLGFSARSYARILKVARTIADLDQSENISTTHLAEAIQYRSLDREGWLAG